MLGTFGRMNEGKRPIERPVSNVITNLLNPLIPQETPDVRSYARG